VSADPLSRISAGVSRSRKRNRTERFAGDWNFTAAWVTRWRRDSMACAAKDAPRRERGAARANTCYDGRNQSDSPMRTLDSAIQLLHRHLSAGRVHASLLICLHGHPRPVRPCNRVPLTAIPSILIECKNEQAAGRARPRSVSISRCIGRVQSPHREVRIDCGRS